MLPGAGANRDEGGTPFEFGDVKDKQIKPGKQVDYTDQIGADAASQRLSQQRAQATRDN